MLTGKNADRQLAELRRRIEAEHGKFKATISAAIQAFLVEHDLTLDDLRPVTAAAPARQARVKRAPVDVKKAPRKALKKRKAAFKGTQPPMYRNPETDATWSGFGRIPGWIAGKDREQFRINGA
jgi:DNA-binding protein H-NS